MKKKRFICLSLLLIAFLFQTLTVHAKEEASNLVNIYLFYSKTCTHCEKELAFLEEIEDTYSNVKIYKYEVSEEETKALLETVEDIYQISATGVPITIIGGKVYTGYSENNSKLKFTKTIIYYSKYGYTDYLGEYLNLDDLPTYQRYDDNPSLSEFLDSFGNYKLIFDVYTDDLDVSTSAAFLGILSIFNIAFLVVSLIVVLLLLKEKSRQSKFILLTFYLLCNFLLFGFYFLESYRWLLGGSILIFILGFIAFIRLENGKTKLNLVLIILLSFLANLFGSNFYSNYLSIFDDLILLNGLSGFDSVMFYAYFLTSVFIFSLLIILILSKVVSVILVMRGLKKLKSE